MKRRPYGRLFFSASSSNDVEDVPCKRNKLPILASSKDGFESGSLIPHVR